MTGPMTQPLPDPGNSPPEDWSKDFDEGDPVQLEIFEDINARAVSMPEPERDDA